MKVVYVSEETHRLLRIPGKPMGDVIRDAILHVVEGGSGGEVIDYPKGAPEKRVKVSEEVWYLLNRLKVELDYDKVDDLVFDAVVVYLVDSGLEKDCIVNLLNLRV